MIDDVSSNDDVVSTIIVGDTQETMGCTDVNDITENVCELMRRAKTMTPSVTVSSVLPSKRKADPQRLAEVNNQIRLTCNETDVTFVDNDANFPFRNGAVDIAAFQKDGLHL